MIEAVARNAPLPDFGSYRSGRRHWLGGRSFWLCQILGWGGLLSLTLVTWAVVAPSTRPVVHFSISLMFFSGLLFSILIREAVRWLDDTITGAKFFLYLTAVVGLLAAVMGILFWLATPLWLPPSDRPPALWLALQFGFLLGGWTAVYLAAAFYRRHREAAVNQLRLESARRDAELRALQARVNPHFLFNSLNTLRALIPRELEKPRTAVTMLAEILRASLHTDQHELVPLARELETIDNYVTLEQFRFESRLRLSCSVHPDALSWPVPPFLIQSMVENAVKHGIAPREEGGEVALGASVVDGRLHVRITNPGTAISPEKETGVGLANARARLNQLFGTAASLTLRQLSADQVALELAIPRHTAQRLHA